MSIECNNEFLHTSSWMDRIENILYKVSTSPHKRESAPMRTRLSPKLNTKLCPSHDKYAKPKNVKIDPIKCCPQWNTTNETGFPYFTTCFTKFIDLKQKKISAANINLPAFKYSGVISSRRSLLSTKQYPQLITIPSKAKSATTTCFFIGTPFLTYSIGSSVVKTGYHGLYYSHQLCNFIVIIRNH